MKTKMILLTAAFGLTSALALGQTTIASFPMTGDSISPSLGGDIAVFSFSGTDNFSDVAATTGFNDAVNQTGGWGTGSYWELTLDLTDYTDASISAWGQRSSNTGPRDFRVIVSYNGGTDFSTIVADYTVPNTTAGFSGSSFSLGALADNNSDVVVRWLNFSDTSVTGGTINAGAGTSRFTDFTVTAIPEPGSIILMGIMGAAAFLVLRRKKT